MNRNNVSLDALERTLESFRTDPAAARRANRVEGTWDLEPGRPQFQARVKFEGGEVVLEADQPTWQGCSGSRPGPMLYCLYGMACCYAATFATVAASLGVELKSLRVAAESDVDFAAVFGLHEAPIVEGVRLSVYVESDAPRERLEEVRELATRRCPGVYCATHAIPVRTELHSG